MKVDLTLMGPLLDLLYTIRPIARFSMQMRDRHNHDSIVVLAVNNSVGKSREQSDRKSVV